MKRVLMIVTGAGATLVPMVVYAQSNYVRPGGDTTSLIRIPFPSFLQKSQGPAGQVFFGNTALQIIDVALLVIGTVAVLFLIFGGFRYVTAFGNEEQTESAKKIIKNSIIGLLIVIMSFALVAIITNIAVRGQP